MLLKHGLQTYKLHLSPLQTESKPGLSLQTESKPGLSLQTESKPSLSLQTESKPGLSLQTESKPGLSLQTESKPGLSLQTESKPGLSLQTESKPGLSSAFKISRTSFFPQHILIKLDLTEINTRSYLHYFQKPRSMRSSIVTFSLVTLTLVCLESDCSSQTERLDCSVRLGPAFTVLVPPPGVILSGGRLTRRGLSLSSGSEQTGVILEVFLDLMCWRSAEEWRVLKHLADHYRGDNVTVVINVVPLPYHRNSIIGLQVHGLYFRLNT